MKKKYEKPVILFDNFALSTNIAGDCGKKTNTPAQGTCAYVVTAGPKTWNVFMSDMELCTTSEATDGAADGAYNGICYHIPTEGYNLFNS